MNEIKYNFYHWGPFLFHSTMDKESLRADARRGIKS